MHMNIQEGEYRMHTAFVIEQLQKMALRDPQLKAKILATKKADKPLAAFCALAREYGFELCEMDIIEAGEGLYATIKRSTNGGGENSPKLEYQDDLYEMLVAFLSRTGVMAFDT